MVKVKHVAGASEKIDEVIADAEPFAKPILVKLRKLIHKADPYIIEDWKWGPNFYKDGMVCGFWAFKKHVNFVFWNGSLMKDPYLLFNSGEDNERTRSIKFTDIKQLDEHQILEYLVESIGLNSGGAKAPKKIIKTEVPEILAYALGKNRKAKAFFDSLAAGYKRDYIDWINNAKQEATREKRLITTISNLELGIKLNDKYAPKK